MTQGSTNHTIETGEESTRSVSQAVTAAVLLLIGIVGGGFLVKSALAAPLPGVVPMGTPLADTSTIVMDDSLSAVPIQGPSTLVLYESNEPASELAATAVVNLSGHFGAATAKTIDHYVPGEGATYDGVVFVGVFGSTEIEAPFLTEVAEGAFDVLWLGEGIDQITNVDDRYFSAAGWLPQSEIRSAATTVTYKGSTFERDPRASATVTLSVTKPADVEVLATSLNTSGIEQPWAIRAGNVTYVAESPFDYMSEGNHSLVVADLLFDLLDPERPERHRALVRLEDVGPYADPESLRAIADELSARKVPFTVAVYTVWRDPKALYNWGTEIRLADQPEVVEALKYMQSKGGTLLMHGISHQYGEGPNPYEGVSGEDFEFYLAHLDEANNVILDGPTPEDSPEWMRDRIHQGFAEMADAGLGTPTYFEFPHYAGSPVSYQTITPYFEARYDQGSYFPGLLSGGTVDANAPFTQFVPYPVYDVYGEYVIPENLGNIIPVGYNNHDDRFPQDLVNAANATMVVRDSVASFFFHPFLDISMLLETVDGMTALGYTFVSPDAILEGWR